MPGESGTRHPGHHLVWYLLGDSRTRRRDFLWREAAAQGTFYILSARAPVDDHNLFHLDEPKLFAPVLAEGDHLRFSLRANPVVRRAASSGRSAKHDVVFDALRHYPSCKRAAQRLEVVRESGFAWLAAQGRTAGFAVEEGDIGIDRYQQHRVSRKGGAIRFSTLDIEGVLHVREPSVFLDAVLRGFGSAKAYGCGLMLIRRA